MLRTWRPLLGAGSEAALAASIDGLRPGERAWITFEEGRARFSGRAAKPILLCDIEPWRYVAKSLEDDGRVVFFSIRIAAPREGNRSSDFFVAGHQLRPLDREAGIGAFHGGPRNEIAIDAPE